MNEMNLVSFQFSEQSSTTFPSLVLCQGYSLANGQKWIKGFLTHFRKAFVTESNLILKIQNIIRSSSDSWSGCAGKPPKHSFWWPENMMMFIRINPSICLHQGECWVFKLEKCQHYLHLLLSHKP